MFRPYTVALFGHRQLANALPMEHRLEELIANLLRAHAQVEFLLGRNGEFNLMAASVIRRVRRDFGDRSATLTLVLPYVTAEYRDNEEEFSRYYDSIEVFPAPPGLPRQACIPLRNRALVDRADALVCGLEQPSGSAYAAAQYARAQQRPLLLVGSVHCI